MLTATLRTASLALAAGGLALAVPASALPTSHTPAHAEVTPAYGDMTANHHRGWHRQGRDYGRGYRSSYQPQSSYYGEPVYDNTRVWRGEDNRYYCRKSDGTTGLIIGGAAGALLGREIAGGGNRTLGTILGAAGGALLGKKIDSKVRCN